MKTNRLFVIVVTVLSLFSLGCICSCCGGMGNQQTNKQQGNAPEQEQAAMPTAGSPAIKASPPAKIASASKDDADKATIREAAKRRNEALAKLEKVRGRNADKKRQYEKELEVFNKAKTEYEEKLKAQGGVPSFGQKRPVAPRQPNYESEPTIPEVLTLGMLRERHVAEEERRVAEEERRVAEERKEAARKAEAERQEAARKAEEEYDADGLVLLLKTVSGKQTKFSTEITGTVVNRRLHTLSYAHIIFNLYDASGAQIGSALANVNGLESGGRWNFKAVGLNPAPTYKFSKLSGFR